MAEEATSKRHTCPDCKNEFVQPFVCTTCGAQKLYDKTVRSQAAQIEQLTEWVQGWHGLVAAAKAAGEIP